MATEIVETPRASWLKRMHYMLLSAAGCALCVSAQVKFAEIQLLELIFACDLFVIAAWFVLHPTPLTVFRPFWNIGVRWTIFSVLAILFAIYGLNQEFFLGTVGALKLPLVATVSRIVELFLDIFFMLYLAEAYREDEQLRRFAALAYYWVGIAGAVYGILSVVALFAGIRLGGANPSFRVVGFNNEAGPYGTYLLTVILMTAVLRGQEWIGRRTAIASYLLFGIALIASQSKSALFEAMAFSLLIPALRMRGLKLVFTTAATVVVLCLVYVVVDIPGRLAQYTEVAQQYEAISVTRPDDYNVVAGRVAGLYLAPKMIAAHPLTGIGLGNYPIVRDDPVYRRGTPLVAIAVDSPGLGFVDYLVDLGIPLFLFLTWIEVAPALDLLKLRRGTSLTCLLLAQPVSNWFGAHLNLTYPWIAAAIALGTAYALDEPRMEQDRSPVFTTAALLEATS